MLETSLLTLDRLALALLFASCLSIGWLNPRLVNRNLPRIPVYFIDLSICLLVISTCGVLLLRTAALADVPIMEAFPYASQVITSSHFGTTWLGRCAALGVILLVWLFIRKTPSSPFCKLLILATALIAFFISSASHAGEQGMWTFENITNTLHILAGCLWGGSVILFAVFFKQLTSQNLAYSETAHRLTYLATLALATVLITGGINLYYRLDSLNVLWSSDYGLTLIAKLLFVCLMMAIGALNRFVLIPNVERQERSENTSPEQARATFRRALYFDGFVFLTIMSIAATVATMSPGH